MPQTSTTWRGFETGTDLSALPASEEGFDGTQAAIAELGRELGLDGSIDSLNSVDEHLERMRSRGETVSTSAMITYALGCYVGHVIVKQGKGRWSRAGGQSPTVPFPDELAVLLKGGTFCYPISKVRKRLRNGEEDSVRSFAQFAIWIDQNPLPASEGAVARPAVTSVRYRPWWKIW